MTESEASSRGCAVIARRSRRYCARVAVVWSDLLLPNTTQSSGLTRPLREVEHPCHPPTHAEALSATLRSVI